MILLHNQHDEKSRKFLEQNKDKFKEILEYPDCIKRFPNVSRFPAVAVPVPEYVRDNSLWYLVKKMDNYERLGMVVKDFEELNHKFGCASGISLMDGFVKEKNIDPDFKYFFIDICNDFSIPAMHLAWGAKYVYDLGEKCKNELDEKNKERSIYSERPALETIPESYEIIYPEDIKEAEAIISANKAKTDLRTAVYASK